MSPQNHAAVVTDIRKIEMRRFPMPDAAQTDAVLKVDAASAAVTTTTTFMENIGPIANRHNLGHEAGSTRQIGSEAARSWKIRKAICRR
jgi:hypothetical protein